MHRVDAADTRTDIGTDAIAILFFKVETCILDGKLCGYNGELRIAIHVTGILAVEIIRRLEVRDLSCNLCTVFCCIKERNLSDAVLTFKQALPKAIFSDANRADDAEAGDNNTFCHLVISPLSCLVSFQGQLRSPA